MSFCVGSATKAAEWRFIEIMIQQLHCLQKHTRIFMLRCWLRAWEDPIQFWVNTKPRIIVIVCHSHVGHYQILFLSLLLKSKCILVLIIFVKLYYYIYYPSFTYRQHACRQGPLQLGVHISIILKCVYYHLQLFEGTLRQLAWGQGFCRWLYQ